MPVIRHSSSSFGKPGASPWWQVQAANINRCLHPPPCPRLVFPLCANASTIQVPGIPTTPQNLPTFQYQHPAPAHRWESPRLAPLLRLNRHRHGSSPSAGGSGVGPSSRPCAPNPAQGHGRPPVPHHLRHPCRCPLAARRLVARAAACQAVPRLTINSSYYNQAISHAYHR